MRRSVVLLAGVVGFLGSSLVAFADPTAPAPSTTAPVTTTTTTTTTTTAPATTVATMAPAARPVVAPVPAARSGEAVPVVAGEQVVAEGDAGRQGSALARAA